MNARTTKLPALKRGETYVGITLHNDRLHHLILLAGDESKPWDDAVAWAKKKGGELPSRHDKLVQLKKAKDKFQPRWYWTGEEVAGNAGCAWVATFDSGSQSWSHKSDVYRCRAVRRVAV